MKQEQWKKLLHENKLNENKAKWRPLVSKVSAACEWDYEECTEFIKELLDDINFSDEAKKIKQYMEKI